MSINLHPVSENDKTRGPLGCIRFYYLLQGNGNAFIKVYERFYFKL